jgi:hypothetical protein
MPIRNWLGLILFAAGAWMFTTALQRRKRALIAWREGQARGEPVYVGTSPKFALFVLALTPIMYAALLAAGATTTMAYVMMGGSPFLSFIDLGGFLFLLLGFAVWFTMNTRYRDMAPVAVTNRPD